MSDVDQIRVNECKQGWAAGVLFEQSLLITCSLSQVSETDIDHEFLRMKWYH